MDYTVNYITMCEKAIEIQERWTPKEGDFILNTSAQNGKGHIFINYKYQPNSHCTRWELIYPIKIYKFNIWLPRIDQFMKMSPRPWPAFDTNSLIIASKTLNKFPEIIGYPCMTSDVFSKEMASLMLIMKELYNKMWNGIDWVIWEK